jgi:glycosyltransferase involved in cell wall biosynthesis
MSSNSMDRPILKVRQNKNMDFMSVVLLCHNRKEYSQLALAAIQNQTHRNIKIIVVDNHSTDGSATILPQTIEDDPRAVYLRLDRNSNASNSYMTGIALAQTEFVLVTHDDDILHPDYVKRIIEVLKQDQEIGMVSCNATLIDSEGSVINPRLYELEEDISFDVDEYVSHYCKTKLWLPTPTLCFRKRLHQEIWVKTRFPMTSHPCDIGKDLVPLERYQPSGDIEFCVKLNRYQKIHFIADSLISYRQHSQQESRNVNQWEPMVSTMKSLRRIYKDREDIYQAIDSLFNKYSIQMHLMNGDLKRLRSFLKRRTSGKSNEFTALGKYLYLTDEHAFEECKFTDRNYELLASKVREAEALIKPDIKRPKIVLVGSMLMSFMIHEKLRLEGHESIRVIDMSPSRIGEKFLDTRIESYESLFSTISDIDDYLFVITSERSRDKSIPALIRNYNRNCACVFWQDL